MKKILKTLLSIFILFSLYRTTIAQENDQEDTDLEEVVEQRLRQASDRLQAFIGTVTDKTEDALQIENNNREIKLITVDTDNTSYAETNGSSEAIEYDDIGIGDYILAMGRVDENDVLTTQRIVVTSAPVELARTTYLAKISTNEDDIEVVLLPEEATIILELNTGYDVTETDEDGEISDLMLNDLETDDLIILIGTESDDTFETDRIHLVQRAPENEE